MAGFRGMSTLLAPAATIMPELLASYPGGIGSGPGQLKLPPNYGLVISKAAAETPGIQVAYNDPRTYRKTSILSDMAKAAGFLFSAYTAPISTGLSTLQAGNQDMTIPELTATIPTFASQGGRNMAFSDGDSGFSFDSVFSGINQALQGGLGQSLLNIGTTAAQSYLTNQFAPQPIGYGMGVSGPMAQPVMASVPALSRAASVVGRGFFNRFPNLATSLQALRNRGANVSRASMYAALKRFGPEMLVSGGILTAAAVSELAVAGAGRRRMNPGNVKALRKAHRRMKSFHKVCVDNDQLLKRARRK